MTIVSELQKKIENAVFCYAPTTGQGLVDRSECACAKEGKTPSCKAHSEKERFHTRYRKLEEQQLDRNTILSLLKEEFDWENSEWLKYNVQD